MVEVFPTAEQLKNKKPGAKLGFFFTS